MARSSRAFVAVVLIALFLRPAPTLWGQRRTRPVECSGTVVDDHGRPVPDAEVICAEQVYDYAAGRTTWGRPGRTTTDSDGRFRVQTEAERRDYVWVVAWKQGLSLGWQWLRTSGSAGALTVRLSEPAVLAGVVVEENGKPVVGATIRPCLKMPWMDSSPGVRFDEPREWFTARTDAEGRFRFERIPSAATADFWVEAAGRASCWTYWENDRSSAAGTQFKAGQTDIRIVLKPEAIVRGRVVEEETGQGIAGVLLLARPDVRYANYSCVDPVTSGPDGAFVYRGLGANDYSLQVVAPHDRTADWTGKDVKVTAVAGQTVEVNIPVSKGGWVEITVQDAATGKPIPEARATVNLPANFGLHPCWYHSVYADEEGVVRLRAPAGECRLSTWAEGYDYFSDPEPAVVAKGQVLQRQVRLDAFPVVTGTVRDPERRPAAGVMVDSKPLCEESARTDEQGRFRVSWRPSPNVRNVLVLARDPDRNLAGLADVKDQAQPVEVTLAPAFALRGRITDPNGKAIPMATVSLRASMPGWLTDAAPAVLTDANGVYEARAIPAPTEGFSCQLEVHAQGYGPTRVRDLPFDTAQDRRVNVATIVLPVADKSLSGVVVDANGAPGAGLPIFISGPRGSDTAGQPRLQTVSDEQGRFAVDGVCAGPLRIQASYGSSPGGAGFLDAQGGDRDVKVVLGSSGVHTALKSLLGKPLPDWKGLMDLEPQQAQGKAILLCFFDLQQRPSRHCTNSLTRQADALKHRGVIVAAIQAAAVADDTWNAWARQHSQQLTLGRIPADAEKVRLAWGVRSLPWLILTDAQHIVRAEGFAVGEIDRVLEKVQ